MDRLIGEILSDPSVGELLVPDDPIIAPSFLINSVAQTSGAEPNSQIAIDSASGVPAIAGALAAMTGTDTDGTPIAIANIRLSDTGDERVRDAERKVYELAASDDGPLDVNSISPVIVEDEYTEATESGLAPLLGLALVLIALLLVLFTRTLGDMLLTLTGLIISIVWIIGAEGWLGPNGLSMIGSPSSLTAMVPVIVISLTVDYAIQAISHYREQQIEGVGVVMAVRKGLSNVTIPLTLAAVTTIVSFLATQFSPIGVVADFGIVAGLGVGLSLIVMLTLIPAGRTIIDRRREARGTLAPPRAISNALPGITPVAEMLGRAVTRWPAPFLVVVIAVTVGLGFAATGLKSEFSIRDILPRNGEVIDDMETLDAAVGGSTEMTSLLVKAEATDTRTFMNLHDLTTGFEDEQRRPRAAAGPILASYELFVHDWTDDSGEPGDKYDSDLAALFAEATAGVEGKPELMQEFLDRLEELEPAVGQLLVDDPQGIETILIQFPTYTNDPEGTGLIQEEIEELWFGDDKAITAISDGVVSIAVTD